MILSILDISLLYPLFAKTSTRNTKQEKITVKVQKVLEKAIQKYII